MMLPAFGLEATETHLIQLCGTNEFGTTCEQICEAAKLLGLQAEAFKGLNELEIVKFLKKRLPVIALIDAAVLYGGNPVSGHFVVALHMQDDQLFYHDPAMGPGRSVPVKLFLSAWKVFDFRGVRLWKLKKSMKK
jgi:ABC-type bacteriocin/lantibiotic exporter with double-glycine peptidase domain